MTHRLGRYSLLWAASYYAVSRSKNPIAFALAVLIGFGAAVTLILALVAGLR